MFSNAMLHKHMPCKASCNVRPQLELVMHMKGRWSCAALAGDGVGGAAGRDLGALGGAGAWA